jgi:hypothetical protein
MRYSINRFATNAPELNVGANRSWSTVLAIMRFMPARPGLDFPRGALARQGSLFLKFVVALQV